MSCDWEGDAYAWIDENENGKWDDGEPPLPDTTFYTTLREGPPETGVGTSDAQGRAHLTAW
jgi:hypothetical protein